ncbi:MAG TPA: ATP-binding protein [Ramlibacter sp.]|jgi:PAS domain S-box-containing protein|uniref:hybrid sensor histidine kinase/response regulator n=1 Tax=Ramlibacter sp. TaxID=1917967 RepID=UPI002D2992EB|nr:ATP-binding protein [Ramlibacter sp.]HZY20265.1 ATP-binding protein [Ramlibacter sp.]
MTEPAEPRPFLPGASDDASETARLFAATDWSATPLGPADHWPRSLRTAVSICLNSRFPMFVWWGEQLVNIYNDAYVPVLGKRHPNAFARPARESWSDIWDVLGPQVETVMRQGRATWNERVLLVMERNGYPEDTWFTWSYSPVQDDQGGIGGLFCACVEETPRVLAERERDRLMREAQDTAHTLRTWFDNAPGFIAVLRGPQLVFEMVNKAYYQLVGHKPLEGKPVWDALPELRDQGFEELLQRVYDSGEPFVGRALPLRVQMEPGGPWTERFVDLVYQPVQDAQGQVAGIFAQGHDVTEQVVAVRALETADRRKDEFLATLAHELRNPLAPIRQAATLAQTASSDPARRDWALDVIQRQAGHMALLLDDLLDISRISRGRLPLRRQHMDLQEAVQAALETVRPLMDRKEHHLRVDIQPGIALFADPIRLAQVLSNLLSNAGKYTDPGGHIELRAQVAGDQLALVVRDDGIGLSPEAQQEIFGMFSQVSNALERAEGGLGIGLALTRALVMLHGGTIEVHSDGPGRGSQFTVRLPLGKETMAPPGEDVPPQPAPAPLGGRSILVADDSPDALETMAALLEMDGHRVRVASDGRQALAAAQAAPPDVAVLDIGMPGLNGYEVARRIRAQPWGADVLLIALTGWGQAEDVERAHAAGFDHHVTKPVDFEALQRLVGGEGAAAG